MAGSLKIHAHMLLFALLLLLFAPGAQAKKRSMVWVYGSDLFPEGPKLEATLKELASHTDAFNAVSPQMYSVGCAAAPPAPPSPEQHYIETTGIKYCNGAGELDAGNAFGAGCWDGGAPGCKSICLR